MADTENTAVLGSQYKDAKRDRRRAEMLDAAATVFARKGYFAATMQDIAEIVGVRSASLYYYFGSKEAALEEVCRLGGRAFVDTLAELAESDRPTVKIIEAGMKIHLDSRWRDYVASFTFNRQNLSGRALDEMTSIARDYAALWQRILERGQSTGELASTLDTRFTASAILAVLNNAATGGDPAGQTHDATIEKTLALVLDGVRRRDRTDEAH